MRVSTAFSASFLDGHFQTRVAVGPLNLPRIALIDSAGPKAGEHKMTRENGMGRLFATQFVAR